MKKIIKSISVGVVVAVAISAFIAWLNARGLGTEESLLDDEVTEDFDDDLE